VTGNVAFFIPGLHDAAKEISIFAGIFSITFPFLVAQAELKRGCSSAKVPEKKILEGTAFACG